MALSSVAKSLDSTHHSEMVRNIKLKLGGGNTPICMSHTYNDYCNSKTYDHET